MTGHTFIVDLEFVMAFTLYGPRKSMAVEVKGGDPKNILSSGMGASCWLIRILNLLRHSRQSPDTFLVQRSGSDDPGFVS